MSFWFYTCFNFPSSSVWSGTTDCPQLMGPSVEATHYKCYVLLASETLCWQVFYFKVQGAIISGIKTGKCHCACLLSVGFTMWSTGPLPPAVTMVTTHRVLCLSRPISPSNECLAMQQREAKLPNPQTDDLFLCREPYTVHKTKNKY